MAGQLSAAKLSWDLPQHGLKVIFTPWEASGNAPTHFPPFPPSGAALLKALHAPHSSLAKLWEFSSSQQPGRLALRVKGLPCWHQPLTAPWKLPNSSGIAIYTVILVGAARNCEEMCAVLCREMWGPGRVVDTAGLEQQVQHSTQALNHISALPRHWRCWAEDTQTQTIPKGGCSHT